MAYEVLARKWRPQQFSDVVGQEHVTQTLSNAVESNRLAHAYLFVGPRGIGKTSIARIFAKALNCEKGTSASPCGKCDACREIVAGSSLDVLEIDGASNNGVEQVREIRDTVKFAPARGPYKIYIIDEVHMLTVAAFNALLKTLEEPPEHVKFFFATTEPQKVLATVVSRCQRFDLRRIPVRLIADRLKEIAKAEKVKIDEDALLAIARGAEGGLRDAESALDQLIAFRGNRIKEDDVLSVFGLVSRKSLEELAGAILAGDVKSLVGQVGELDAAGKDLQRLVIEMIEHFRNLLVLISTGDAGALEDLTESQVEMLRAQAESTDTGRALRVVTILTEVEDRMKFALSRRTLLETALIRCSRAATVASLQEILEKLNAIQAGGSGEPPGEPGGAARDVPRPAAPEPTPGGGAPASAEVTEAPPAADPAPAAAEEGAADPGADLERLAAGWSELLVRIGKQAMLARTALADARPVRVDAERVAIAFDPEFAEEMEGVQAGRDRKVIERALSTFLGRRVTAQFEVAAESFHEDISAAEAPEESASESGIKPAPPKPIGERKTPRDWVEDEAVRKTLDMFNGSIRDVRN